MSVKENRHEPYQGYPAVGAVHPVIANRELRERLTQIANIADDIFDHTPTEDDILSWNNPIEIEGLSNPVHFDQEGESDLPGHEELEEDDTESTFAQVYNPTAHYRMFDAQTLGLSVFPMEVSAAIANRARAVWKKNDLGQLTKEIIDRTQRYSLSSALTIVSDGLVLSGGKLPVVPHLPIRSMLAFNVSPAHYDESLECIFEEHEIVKSATLRRMKKRPLDVRGIPQDPISAFIPHIPFMAYKRGAIPAEIAKVNEKIQELMHDDPIVMHLGELTTERSRLVSKVRKG